MLQQQMTVRWSFTYTEDYQLIKEGSNELTAKISCYAVNNPTPLSEWHTVNVTGVAAGQPIASPTEEEPVPDTNEDEGEEDTHRYSAKVDGLVNNSQR